MKEFVDGKEEIEGLQERITGRFAAETICDRDGNVLVKANHMITPKRAEAVMAKGVDENGAPLTQVKIRTILSCRCHMGVCAKCYGSNMATGQAGMILQSLVESLLSISKQLPSLPLIEEKQQKRKS